MDVGGEYAHYAADLTRTVPVDGVFTKRQREIYDLVLHVQRKVIAAVKPGETLRGLTHKAKRYFDEAGQDAVGEAMGARFLHGVGHSVGLGVHDPIDFSQPLKAGMVITIEPGLYLPEEKPRRAHRRHAPRHRERGALAQPGAAERSGRDRKADAGPLTSFPDKSIRQSRRFHALMNGGVRNVHPFRLS